MYYNVKLTSLTINTKNREPFEDTKVLSLLSRTDL